MKYFVSDLEEDRWDDCKKKYWAAFETFKNKLPQNFVSAYEKHAFHDFQFIGIKISKGGSLLKLTIQLIDYWDDKKIKLIYKNVSNFQIIGTFQVDKIFGIWDCSELSLNNQRFTHEIRFDEGMSILVEFEELKYIKNNH